MINKQALPEKQNLSYWSEDENFQYAQTLCMITFKFMERTAIESMSHELSPEALGNKFNTEDFSDFIAGLRQKVKENPSIRFTIIVDWVSIQKARAAKTLLDQYASRFNIDSITIRSTRQQYEEDVNIFESGVKWEEVKG